MIRSGGGVPAWLAFIVLACILHPSAGAGRMTSVIVKLDEDSLATYRGGVYGLRATSIERSGAARLDATRSESRAYLDHLTQRHAAFEATVRREIPAARVVHHFRVVFGGVSMLIPDGELERVRALPGVKAVYPDELHQVRTTRSPAFIGARHLWRALGGQGSAGEGVIVGELDTGIWPEHPSFADPDPFSQPYPTPPARWTGTTCQFSGGANPGPPASCNNKLLGAYRFMATYDANQSLLPGEFTSARDDDGHGTHTSSTAAGNGGVVTSILGIPRGTASGIAPRAHVVMYKVCGFVGCYNSDSMAAVEQAITDGVDVLNFSIGGGNHPYSDAVELAFLDAYAAGVFVAASAGNDGPDRDTVEHAGPWVTTVAASTEDRQFETTATLTATGGDMLALTGASLTSGIAAPTMVLNAADVGDALCENATPDSAFAGAIVICERGTIARVAKSFNVQQRGAVGMLLYNPTLQGLATDNHLVPSVHFENDAGTDLLAFFTGHTNVMASFPSGVASPAQGDVVAAFSSRGGAGQFLGVSKPDVTAPGVQILAGNSPQAATIESGVPGELFQAIQGTSMSSPHVAGAAALLRALHPAWSPGRIKSALMTTATTAVVKEDGVTPADAFDVGSGRIDLRRAGTPGLSFDVSASDYVAHADDLWNVNYPSVFVPKMPGRIAVMRTAHNELATAEVWQLQVDAPPDLDVTVPSSLAVPAGGDAAFRIGINARDLPLGAVRHATLTLSGPTTVHLRITIVRAQPSVALTLSCTPATLARGQQTACTLVITNNGYDEAAVMLSDRLPAQLDLVPGSAMGAVEAGNGVTFTGTVAGSSASGPGTGGRGESHTITFSARGLVSGAWRNCAKMTSPQFSGTNLACAAGRVTP